MEVKENKFLDFESEAKDEEKPNLAKLEKEERKDNLKIKKSTEPKAKKLENIKFSNQNSIKEKKLSNKNNSTYYDAVNKTATISNIIKPPPPSSTDEQKNKQGSYFPTKLPAFSSIIEKEKVIPKNTERIQSKPPTVVS